MFSGIVLSRINTGESCQCSAVDEMCHLKTRLQTHRKTPSKRKLEASVLGEKLTYEEVRGLEQTAMLYYHTLKTAKGLNRINRISPKNKKVEKYMEAAEGVAGYITNQISNEILNWMNL